jgi:FecR protein
MKKTQFLFAAAVCGLVVSFASVASADDSIKQGVATVVRVKGEASYTLGGSDTWHPLVPGKILQAGSIISTKPDAVVDVVLGKQVAMPQTASIPDRVSPAADAPVRGMISCQPAVEQNLVRLSGGTTLKIDTLTTSDTGVDTVSDTELDLQAGRIFASVKKLSDDSKYLVKIPNGIAGVRGTKFTLDSNGSAACIEHSVWLAFGGSGGTPTTVEVAQGTQYDPASGKTAPIPSEIASQLQGIAVAAGNSYQVNVSYAANLSYLTQVTPTAGRFKQ